MASREGFSPFQSLWRSPLPLWSGALLVGQALAGARLAIDTSMAVAWLGAAFFALLARRWWIAIGLLLAVAGYHQVDARMRPPSDRGHIAAYAPGSAMLRAEVVDVDERDAGKVRLLLEAEAIAEGGEWHRVAGLIQTTLARSHRVWHAGTSIEARLALRRPRNFGNPGEFDYEGYLARRSIYVTAFVLDDGELNPIGGGPPDWIEAWRERVRALLVPLTTPAREILAALILGEMGALPPELQRQFAATGVSHVLSISGLHVAMVAGSAFAILRWLLARSEWLLLRARVPVLAAGLSLVPVWLYAELARAAVATWRSFAMLGVVVVAVLTGRQNDMLVSVAAAALVVGLVWPGVALDVSFQLSFVAVIALVLAMDRYWRWWSAYQQRRLLALRGSRYRWLGWGLASLAVNLSALIATTPLTAFHFNQVAPIALLANPIVVPLLGTVAVALGMIGALLSLCVESAARWSLQLAGLAVMVGARLVEWMSTLPGAGVHVITPTLLELSLIYAAMIVSVIPRSRRGLAAATVIAVLLLTDIGWAAHQRWHRAGLRVTFLSVGQGDATVIQFPGSEVMVVDGGGLYGLDSGARVVAPYLWRERIARVDYVVMTHPQFDHYGGLTGVVREFTPREFWFSGATSDAASFAEMRREIVQAGTREVLVGAGQSRRIGGCDVDVLWPPADLRGLQVNDTSVVMRISCADGSVLLTGDLEGSGERGLLERTQELRADVLKVGHHGSRTSSTRPFLAAVEPRVAVISLGLDNRFGFPDAGVVRALDRSGAELYRTDLDGAVIAESGRDNSANVLRVSSTRTESSRSTVVDSLGAGVYRPRGDRGDASAPGPSPFLIGADKE